MSHVQDIYEILSWLNVYRLYTRDFIPGTGCKCEIAFNQLKYEPYENVSQLNDNF